MDEPKEPCDEQATKSGFWTWGRFRDAGVGLVMLVISVRLAFAQTTIDLSGFNFTDLLSLILALGAVGLSAAFYFKADESARSFYNNTYHFTKEVSEILGRIEAGFGKQLEHINQNYAGLSDKFDRIPFDSSFIREQEAEKLTKIQDQENERDKIINDLMRRAQMDDAEKIELRGKLSALSSELEQSKGQLAYLKNVESTSVNPQELSPGFVEWLYDRIDPYFPNYLNYSPAAIQNRFKKIIDNRGVSRSMVKDMEKLGFFSEGELTSQGVKLIQSLIQKKRSSG